MQLSESAASLPSSNTGAQITSSVEVGFHWLTGTVVPDGGSADERADAVLGWLARDLQESVEILDRGGLGYSRSWRVGPARVLDNPDRPEMGVCVVLDGSACEELGSLGVARIQQGLGLRVSRGDVACDGAGFTPGQLRDEWQADNVRSRTKIPAGALESRQFRTCRYIESPTGDTFEMGSRTAEQFARCYDRRGFVRFELELKGRTAAVAVEELCKSLVSGNDQGFRVGVIGLVRRFVDFVVPASDSNVTRQALSGFWAEFVGQVEKARLVLGAAVVRSAEEVRDWVERQVAPALALIDATFGQFELGRLIDQGKSRWKQRHKAAVRAYRGLGPLGA